MWTIFFHRLFGPVTPITTEFMDIAYPMAANLPDLDSLIDTKIDQLIRKDFGAGDGPREGQLMIQFLDGNGEKSKKKSSWFGHLTEEKPLAPWESWAINVTCLPLSGVDLPAPGDQAVNRAERLLQLALLSFENALAEVIHLVDHNKHHIPPIMTLEVLPFPYEISIGPSDTSRPQVTEDESWGHYIKKIID